MAASLVTTTIAHAQSNPEFSIRGYQVEGNTLLAPDKISVAVMPFTGPRSTFETIQQALEERWQRLKTKRRGRILTTQLEDLLRRVDALPTLDARPVDEILGYDEHGIPR